MNRLGPKRTISIGPRLFCSSESDGKWDYYTLEGLLYFLKNISRNHPDYVKQATTDKMPYVHR